MWLLTEPFQVDGPAFGAGPSRRNKADAGGRAIARQGKYPLAGLTHRTPDGGTLARKTNRLLLSTCFW